MVNSLSIQPVMLALPYDHGSKKQSIQGRVLTSVFALRHKKFHQKKDFQESALKRRLGNVHENEELCDS